MEPDAGRTDGNCAREEDAQDIAATAPVAE
jgi:hypothetical protein